MRGLIFGFDGVLVDERPARAEVLRRVLAEEDLEISEASLRALLDAAISDPERIARALDAAGEPATPNPLLAARLTARFGAYYQRRVRREGPSEVAGATELVENAHARGWTLAVLSPAPRGEVESALDQLEIRDFFKTLVAGTEASAAAYQEAWRQLNSLPPLPARLLHPHEILVLDAEPAALEAARDAGLVPVALTTRHAAPELAAADLVLESPGELLISELAKDHPS